MANDPDPRALQFIAQARENHKTAALPFEPGSWIHDDRMYEVLLQLQERFAAVFDSPYGTPRDDTELLVRERQGQPMPFDTRRVDIAAAIIKFTSSGQALMAHELLGSGPPALGTQSGDPAMRLPFDHLTLNQLTTLNGAVAAELFKVDPETLEQRLTNEQIHRLLTEADPPYGVGVPPVGEHVAAAPGFDPYLTAVAADATLRGYGMANRFATPDGEPAGVLPWADWG
ncbi:MAG: hypothetical protein ACRDPW_00320, partial [Mycobacteriales bacterium]